MSLLSTLLLNRPFVAYFRKQILLSLLSAFVVIILVGCNRSPNSTEAKQVTGHNLPPDRVSLKIDFGEARESVEFHADLQEGMTVFELLKQAADSKGVELDYRGAGETAFVSAIGGIEGGKNGNHWWLFFVNDQMSKIGSGVYTLRPNDAVQWRMGKYE